MADFEFKIPKITNSEILPTPVNINSSFLLSVSVIDETVFLDAELIYSGEIYSGEAD